MVICLERGADLHVAQLMPLPLTVSCFSKIQIGFTFLVLAHPGSPGQRVLRRVCVCVVQCGHDRCTRTDNRALESQRYMPNDRHSTSPSPSVKSRPQHARIRVRA